MDASTGPARRDPGLSPSAAVLSMAVLCECLALITIAERALLDLPQIAVAWLIIFSGMAGGCAAQWFATRHDP